jgi:hypothetical protein
MREALKRAVAGSSPRGVAAKRASAGVRGTLPARSLVKVRSN